MKFQLRQGVNSCSGDPMFYVYSWEGERWSYRFGFGNEAEARNCIARLSNPVKEIVLDEIEA